MRLADDDRARVPFAIVGIVLLLGSATYAATMARQPARAGRPAESLALERADALADTAVSRGTARAAQAAARDPVTEPADTPAGRVLNGTDTFRDYLRVRIYLAVREELAFASTEVGGVRATASLPATLTPRALRRAKRRVHVESVDNGTAIRVRIEGVRVVLRRNGQVVQRRERTVERTVATPVLALHDSVEEYERRLDRGPTAGPGLGQRLTLGLYWIAWVRGYAQYGGVPIENVIANRHVEVMTNAGALGTQRSVFGRRDPDGQRAATWALAKIATQDLLGATNTQVPWQQQVLERRPGAPRVDVPERTGGPDPNATTTVGVNLSADRAYVELFDDSGGTSRYGEVVSSVYSADVKLTSTYRLVRREPRPRPDPPGENWSLADERVERWFVDVSDGDGPTPPFADGWHRIATYTRRVTVIYRVTRIWRKENGRASKRTNATWTSEYRVGVALDGRHAPSEVAPRRAIETVHERGGPLDGPNLVTIERRAIRKLVTERGGPDQIVRLAVTGDLNETAVSIDGRRPNSTELREWIVRDLAALRNRVRNVTVTIPRGELGTGGANPARKLAAELHERRASLVDAPRTYGSVAEKARVAVRAAYVDAVIARLEERAGETKKEQSKIDDVLKKYDISLGQLDAIEDARTGTQRPPAHPLATGELTGPVNATVSGSPPYLTLASASHEQVPAVDPGREFYPLVARNVNVFTLPYGDAADTVIEEFFGSTERTNLRIAAAALRSANRTLAEENNATLRERRDELQKEVSSSMVDLRLRIFRKLKDETELTPEQAMSAVNEGFARWDTTATRALAATNGSAARAIALAAARRTDMTEYERELLAAKIRVEIAEDLKKKDVRPGTGAVNETSAATRKVVSRVVETAIQNGMNRTIAAAKDKWFGDKMVTVPAGLPLTPVPGYWYATMNIWWVTVRGEYARFAVTAETGTPSQGRLTYERDGEWVAFDFDDDGATETFGQSDRVNFSVSTGVVVVVPPGPSGVGDTNGQMIEESSGWPNSGYSNSTAGRARSAAASD